MILNLGAFLMALLIVYYLVILLIQEMYFCLKCYVKHQVPKHAQKKRKPNHMFICVCNSIRIFIFYPIIVLCKQWIAYTKLKLGFSIDDIMNINLLNSLLVSWNNILNNQISSKNIQPIYLKNMESNPWYQQYKNLLKNQLIMKSMHILSSNVINDSTSTTFLMMVLKLCMLLKKYNITFICYVY
jgi:hypothetical protein